MKRHVQAVHSIHPENGLVQHDDGTFSVVANQQKVDKLSCMLCPATVRDRRELQRHFKKKHPHSDINASLETTVSSETLSSLETSECVPSETLVSSLQAAACLSETMVPASEPSQNQAMTVTVITPISTDATAMPYQIQMAPVGLAIPAYDYQIDLQQLATVTYNNSVQ